ncbi:MAG: PIN domain-containing protein [Gemmatimonadaceae bacterium]|nr:PIN domain-containing protein [Gemmatimonadaceae bacterium]
MIVLVDTDVLIDLALDRAPFAADAAALLDRLERGPTRGVVAWHSLANFYYLVASRRGRTDTRRFIGELCTFLSVAPTTVAHAQLAVDSPLIDFEDALQVGAAVAAGADLIATRNVRDFRRASIPALVPAAVVKRIA